jgi:hypothetical protein
MKFPLTEVSPPCPIQIIYCATSRVQFTADIEKVDNRGVTNMSRAWIDSKHASAAKAKTTTRATKRMVADFSKEPIQEVWDLMHVGPIVKETGYNGQDFANALLTEDLKRLCFQGKRPVPDCFWSSSTSCCRWQTVRACNPSTSTPSKPATRPWMHSWTRGV